jgi:hypothetical protein
VCKGCEVMYKCVRGEVMYKCVRGERPCISVYGVRGHV